MDATDRCIETIEYLCTRPRMYVSGGSFAEIWAYLSGYAHASTDGPLSNGGWRAFNRVICKQFGFPDKYVGDYVLTACSRDDDEAREQLRTILVQFCNSSRTQTYEEILESAKPRIEWNEAAEPEQAMRKLLAALLTGNRSEVEPLIMDHPDADILWQAAYPPGVADQLGQISDSNPIGRVSAHEKEGEVKLVTADFPFPITVKKHGTQWKVDAKDIIAARKQANELRSHR